MMGIQSVSPKRRDKQPGRDLISDLPLGIIHLILARVPTQDAIRTSVLSKQWRYTWATLPQLAFYGVKDKVYRNEDRLMNFINCAFKLHRAPIHKFKLSVWESMDLPNCDEWLLRLSTNDLRELDLEGIDMDGSSRLYSFQKLTHLKIGGFTRLYPPPPTFKGFLCLRCLDLKFFLYSSSSDEIESLVASSPLLEDLKLHSVSSVVRIRAPKLKYLKLSGAYKEISVYAPILVKMSVQLFVADVDFTAGHYLEQENSVCNYTELLGGLTNLESLSGVDFTKYLRLGFNVCQDSLVFHHLKVISLCNVNFKDKKEVSVVIRLIMDSPNLQNLEISADFWEENALEGPDGSLWDSGFAPDSTFEKLRVVKIINVRGMHHEMEFIKLLLKSSPVLETISIDRSSDGLYTELWWSSFMEILVRYGQAESSNAKILSIQS